MLVCSCSKDEIELPDNTVAFTINEEKIKITENRTPEGITFTNKLTVRSTLIDNNLHIEVRFREERLLLSITDTTEQIYQMDNQSTN